MISKDARVETKKIGKDVRIDEFSVIRANVQIGDKCIIHPNVVIEPGVIIGENVEVFPGTYIGKEPKGAGATARPIEFERYVIIGENCSIGPNAVIFYDVEIKNNTLIGDGASLREKVRVGHHCLISRYVTVNYNTTIGNYTRILDLTHLTGNVFVGNNVFISTIVSTVNDNVVIKREYNEENIIGPHFEDDVTIGASACILPAVRIGKGAFVAAGSVVTKDVPPFTLVMGVPARIVRSLSQEEFKT